MYHVAMVDGKLKAVNDTVSDTEPTLNTMGSIAVNTPLTIRHGWILSHEQGMKPDEICSRFSISRKTFYKWLRRYRQGDSQLLDRSRRPHRMPMMTPQNTIDLLMQEKTLTGFGQRRLRQHMINKHNITISERTIWKHLKRRKEGS